MQEQIQRIDGWESLTATDIQAALAAVVAVPVNKPVTISDLQAAVGDESAALVVGTIKAGQATNPLLEPAMIALSTTGMLLGSVSRQAMIDDLALAGGWTDQLRDTVKGLGAKQLTRWESLGGEGAVPTLEEVSASIQAMQVDTYAAGLASRVSAAVRLAAAADGATEQSVRDAALAEINA